MLIKGLCDCYDILEAQGKVLPDSYSDVNVSFLVSLTEDGKVDGIIDYRKDEIKKTKTKEIVKKVPNRAVLPRRTGKSAVYADIMDHRQSYVFGLGPDKDAEKFTTEADCDKKGKSRHTDYVEKNKAFFEDLTSPVCRAFYNFLCNWVPENETENPHLLKTRSIKADGYVFCLSGHPDILLHEDGGARRKWEAEYEKTAATSLSEMTEGTCSIYGNKAFIPDLHDAIAGTGVAGLPKLICCNNEAEWSYQQKGSTASGVSNVAMKKYTKALSYLMESKVHKTIVGDIILLHWAESENDKYDNVMNTICFGEAETMDREKTDDALKSAFRWAKDGTYGIDRDAFFQNLDPNVNFYIVGIEPNKTRLAVKFVYRQSFGKIFDNLLQHQEDLRIKQDGKMIPIWALEEELISPKASKKKVSSSMSRDLLSAVIMGGAYPANVYTTILRRIKADRDDPDKKPRPFYRINGKRIGMLKAYINRNDRRRGRKERITMSLNPANTDPAYVCGRLFAILESIQRKSANTKLNRTIKDTYFSAAAANPGIVFPKLLTLSSHHIKKLKKGEYAERDIAEVMSILDGKFPVRLSLTDQGVFMIGYYQQRQEIIETIKRIKADASNTDATGEEVTENEVAETDAEN